MPTNREDGKDMKTHDDFAFGSITQADICNKAKSGNKETFFTRPCLW